MEKMQPHIFQNYETLINHGMKSLRADALDITQAAVHRAIPYLETKKRIRAEGDMLTVGDQVYRFSQLEHIYVVGVGKGAYPMAQAIEEILGGRITQGIVLVKKGDHRRLTHIEIIESGHPLPDQAGIDAAKRICALLQKTTERDLILLPITGGSSAMLNLPDGDITLEDMQQTNQLLLGSGADIAHMNAVRKHLCKMKGGHLVEMASPSPMHTFTLNTNPPGLKWPDLVFADSSTFADAIRIMKDFRIWDRAPERVKAHLLRGAASPEMETPKVLHHPHNHIHYVADPPSACEAAAQKAAELGYTPHILSSALDGEAREAGMFFACVANEVIQYGRPFRPPCALISGGETTVDLNNSARVGLGGPNQETVLGFVRRIKDSNPAVCVCVDSDGTDGPTDIAGGISDGYSPERARQLGIPLEERLMEHDAATVLLAMEDALFTGHTGTNIMNIRVVVIGKESDHGTD